MKIKGVGKCLFDMVRGWLWILLAYLLSELLKDRLGPEMPHGLLQFYPYVFILIVTICRIIVVEKNIKKGTSPKRIYSTKQFIGVQVIVMILVPIVTMLILSKSKYMDMNIYLVAKDNLWVLTTVVCIVLLYMIVFVYDICGMYCYNLPIFILILSVTLVIAMNFAIYITPVLVKSFYLAIFVVAVICVGEIVSAMNPYYWMFYRKKKR